MTRPRSAEQPAIAFEGTRLVALGRLSDVAAATKAVVDRPDSPPVLVFDAESSHPIELDLRGSVADVVARIRADDGDAPARRGPGRPRLGVVAREVTLLPRHWEWLAAQPGGASVALRRLVDGARKASETADRTRSAREAAYRFMSAIAGNEPGFEAATRALFAGDRPAFAAALAAWPPDVAAHAARLADSTFEVPE